MIRPNKDPKNTPPQNTNDANGRRVNEALKLAFDNGRWFRFPKVLMTADLTYGEAILLSWLINRHIMKEVGCEEQGVDFDGWLHCACKAVAKDLCMTRDTQRNLFKGLALKGYLSERLAGMPARRQARLEEERFKTLLLGS